MMLFLLFALVCMVHTACQNCEYGGVSYSCGSQIFMGYDNRMQCCNGQWFPCSKFGSKWSCNTCGPRFANNADQSE